MPTSIYIGDIPIEEAYLGDEVVGIDDNNVCRPCASYTVRSNSAFLDTWVSASSCYDNRTYSFDVLSTVTRRFFASEIIQVGPNSVFSFASFVATSQGANACKNAYGKEEDLPTELVTFNNPGGEFVMVGYASADGTWGQGFISPGGSSPNVCLISGSFISLAQITASGTPCP